MRSIRLPVALLSLISLLLATVPHMVSGETMPRLRVDIHKSLLLDLGEPIETVSIADTELADFAVPAGSQVLILGKQEGETSLVVWLRSGRYLRYDLAVRRGFDRKQVMIKARIAEINQTALTEYGIDYAAQLLETGSDRAVAAYPGQIGTPAIPLNASTLPDLNPQTSIALRWYKGSENYDVLIHALQQRGLLRVLARPDLVCSEGREAAFLAGGEIPIPVAQTTTTGAATITIEWREFGVRLRCVPTIIDSNLISLEVEPEVSNLDYGNAVVVGGFVVPALQTRRARTEVELHSQESLIIGGLHSNHERELRRMIPVLGHIPILGHLFRSTNKTREESELVIIVSPEIITPAVAGDEPLLHDTAMPSWKEDG